MRGGEREEVESVKAWRGACSAKGGGKETVGDRRRLEETGET